jgi:hypothetical protein
MNIISDRPSKVGWLQIQVNSFFDIWNARYFYLNGTQVLYFDDE